MIEETHVTDNPALNDFIVQLRNHEIAHQRHRQDLLRTLVTTTRRPPLDFSPVVTIVDNAPDEEAQLEAVMVRLARRGQYNNSLAVELAIATVGPHATDTIVGPHHTDAIAGFLDSLAVNQIDHTTDVCGKKVGSVCSLRRTSAGQGCHSCILRTLLLRLVSKRHVQDGDCGRIVLPSQMLW
jgi:hypothetical protein